MENKSVMLERWLDDWSAKLDELEARTGKDELMKIELFEKYTSFILRLMKTPSKIFDLGFRGEKHD